MRKILLLAAIAALALPCQAQDKPVRILIGFPPGGTTDLLGRVVADRLKDILGQPVLVENRPGAIAAIAAEAVKNAPPDGGTLLLNVVGSMIVAPNARKTNTFDTLRDFAPVSLVTTSHLALAVGPGVPAKTLKEFLDWARANRGKGVTDAQHGTRRQFARGIPQGGAGRLEQVERRGQGLRLHSGLT